MPIRQDFIGVGTIAGSSTFFPCRPVEEGRARGVAGLVLLTNGVSGVTAVSNRPTTSERPLNRGAGLTVTLTAAGGVYTAVAVNAGGTGYRENDLIRVVGNAGTGTVLLLQIVGVSTTGIVTSVVIYSNVTAAAANGGPFATFPIESQGGQGLTVTNTVAGGVATGVSVGNSAGAGYRIGDIITLGGANPGTPPTTCRVSALTG
jgi:hypothetical protein